MPIDAPFIQVCVHPAQFPYPVTSTTFMLNILVGWTTHYLSQPQKKQQLQWLNWNYGLVYRRLSSSEQWWESWWPVCWWCKAIHLLTPPLLKAFFFFTELICVTLSWHLELCVDRSWLSEMWDEYPFFHLVKKQNKSVVPFYQIAFQLQQLADIIADRANFSATAMAKDMSKRRLVSR